jgi:hypothetical protein
MTVQCPRCCSENVSDKIGDFTRICHNCVTTFSLTSEIRESFAGEIEAENESTSLIDDILEEFGYATDRCVADDDECVADGVRRLRVEGQL